MSPLIERGGDDEASGVADSDEQHAAQLAAVARERTGYEAKLAGAVEAGDAEAVAKWEARIASCDAVLSGVSGTVKRGTRRKPKPKGS